jgi:hypothetical protein
MSSDSLVARAAEFHPWDAMAPAALEGLVRRGPFEASCETGCGGSTIVLSHQSKRHVAFAIEGENRTIARLREHPDLRSDAVTFVEGESKATIPAYSFPGALDLALLDGPHAYPLPQVEFAWLFPRIRVGGWLVLDDIQIPSVHELFRFLRMEESVELEEVAVRTAFFSKTREVAAGADGWERQGMNRRPVLRYSWRDQLRGWLGR